MKNKGLDEFIIEIANNVKDEIIKERIDIYSNETFSLKESKKLFKDFVIFRVEEIKKNLSLSAEAFYLEVKKKLENSKDEFLKNLKQEIEDYLDLKNDTSLNDQQIKAVENKINLNNFVLKNEA